MSDHFPQESMPLRAAHIDYFRTPRQNWGAILTRVHQMSANAVSTSLYWGWHEVEESRFDLVGETDPRRDAVGFVNLCAQMGFRLLVRVGPYIGGGVLGGGVPSWLLRRHPEVRALRADGEPWQSGSLGLPRCSYTHPTYLEFVRRWYEKAAEALVSSQWPTGPIIAVQVDHEMSGARQTLGSAKDAHIPNLMGDYNPHVTDTLWPVWLRRRYEEIDALNAAYDRSYVTFSDVPLPREWHEPTTVQALRRYVDADRFADWSFAYGLLTYVKMLRTVGWQVPIYHDLARTSWESTGMQVSTSSASQACDWLSHSLFPDEAHCDTQSAIPGFPQYVHDVYWRTKLLKSYGPQYPAFVSQASAGRPYDLAASLAGGAEAITIYPASQASPDPMDVGASTRWGTEAPIRADGSLRRRFWNAKVLFTYLAATAVDLVGSRALANVALGYSHSAERAAMWGGRLNSLYERQGATSPLNDASPYTREANAGSESQRIAQQLIHHKVAFDVLDVDRAPAEQLARYSALILPSASVMSRQAQQRLIEFTQKGGFLVLIGGELPAYDEALAPCSILADEVNEEIHLLSREKMLALDAAGWGSLLARSGAQIRQAWADAPQVDVGIRYGAESAGQDSPGHAIVFLTVVNRGQDDFGGFVNYTASDGAHQQIELSLASAQVGLVALREGQVVSAVLPRGKVRAADNGFAFDGVLGVVATVGDALMLSARESGTFRLSRASGWDSTVAQRLLLDGRLLEHPVHTIGQTLAVDYLSEDELGETDLILLLDRARPLDGKARQYLDTSLACRRGMLGEAERLAEALRYELSDIEARAEVIPSDSISLTPARDALSEAIRSIDKAARYAQSLRDGLEGRTVVGGADTGVGRLRATAQALAHLVSCRDVAARAGVVLAEAGNRSRMSDAPWTVDAYVSRLSDLRSGIAPLCRELARLLYQLRVDLQVREVDREFAERVQGSVTHLLHILHNL